MTSAYVLKDGSPAGHRAPSQPQKDAGNYEKAHPVVHGMRISIENAAGTKRTGTAPDGKAWETTMRHDYGYVRGSKGKDKDHVDVFLGPEPHGDHDVHVIDQNNADGDFDEHKAMVGFPSATHAVIAYHQNYDPGWDRFRGVTSMPMATFRDWVYAGNERGKQKPAADYVRFAKGERDGRQAMADRAGDRESPGVGSRFDRGADEDAGQGDSSGRGGSDRNPGATGAGRLGFGAGGHIPHGAGGRRADGAQDQRGHLPAHERQPDRAGQATGTQGAAQGDRWAVGAAGGGRAQGVGSDRILTALPNGNVWSKGGVAGMPNLKLDGPSFKKGGSVPDDDDDDVGLSKEDKAKAKAADDAAYAAMRAKPAPQRSNPFEISTRVPYLKGVGEDPIGTLLTVGMDSARAKPSKFAQNAQLVQSYPNYKDSGAKSPEEHAEAFVNHVRDNLLYLHDQMPKEMRERSAGWYNGAHRIANEHAQQYGIEPHQAAGIIAALSPQTDWFMNVSRASRVNDALRNRQEHPWTPEMDAKANEIFAKPEYKPLLDQVRGKSLGQLDNPLAKGMWIRTNDEAHNDRSYDELSPEGVPMGKAMGKNGPANMTWGPLAMLAKTVNMFEQPGLASMSENMGGNHKVRNFYNNILDPESPNGHVTIDTHAVAAGLLRPLGSNAAEVFHNFGTSVKGAPVNAAQVGLTGDRGTYPLYAEAYRRAAADRNIQPRQMQSIAWEAARNLFKDKSAKANALANSIWEDYRNGKISDRIARKRILDAAGGIGAASWLRPAAGLSDDAGAGDAPELPVVQPSRGGARPVSGRLGSLASAALAGPVAGAGRKRADDKRSAAGTQAQGLSHGGSVRGSAGLLEAPDREDQGDRRKPQRPPLTGLPTGIKLGDRTLDIGPAHHVRAAAEEYMREAGLPYNPPTDYAKVDKDRAARIAAAYDAMPHDPQHPQVKAAYDQMVKEVTGQYETALRHGLKVDFIAPDQADPYAASPRLANEDILKNNHMWVYPTRSGFGTSDDVDVSDNPLLAETGHLISGQPATANDLFRVVHDYFGHAKEGVGFRAEGEENAWRQHSAMFSPLARRAMTSETRGQNSWLNFGPHGEKNRTAKTEDTHFADQKTGLLPHWVSRVGSGHPDDVDADEDERKGYAKGGSIPMPTDKAWRQCLAQGGVVKGGRRYLDDGGSAGDGGGDAGDGGDASGGPSGDPGTGDPGAAGIGAGEMGTDAPAASGDPGVGDPGVMGVAQGDIGTSAPAQGQNSGANGILGNLANTAISHGLSSMGVPFGSAVVGLANSAINGNPASGMGAVMGTIGGMIGGIPGAIAGNMAGQAIGNMPGVPATSVSPDMSSATNNNTSPISNASLPGLSPLQMAAYGQAMQQQTQSRTDPMGTQSLLRSSAGGGSQAVYGPGNWAMGMQSGWGFARGGRVPRPQIRMLAGPLSRGAGGMNNGS